jgi:DNA polymerase-1
MRADAQGLFWNETPKQRSILKRNSSQWGPMPHVPDTGWRPPTEFPNIGHAKVIGFDTETFDPELTDAGPGWGRGKGHIIGASIAVEDGTSWYFPMRHGIDENGRQQLPPEHAQMNMDPDQVLRFLDSVMSNQVPKVGANSLYDVGWLNWEGVRVGGPIFDVQYAEPLLDSEDPKSSLDHLSAKYLGETKVTETLYEWLASWNGKPVNEKQRKWLYRTPPVLAGPYAEGDAALPIKILTKQWAAMHERGVLEVYDLECRLIPLLVAMRMKGAPVNLQTAERVYDDFGVRLSDVEAKLKSIAGQEVNPNAADSVTKAFHQCGLPLPEAKDKKTGEMRVTFDKARLEEVEHPLAEAILEWRGIAKVRNTFIKSYILDKHVNSRVYCSFHPLRGKDGGARSGRFASSDPNLQNIPTRSEDGQLVRECFDGTLFGNRWRAFDYSSIEYRLLAHFAVGAGADDVRAIFAENPEADYHAIVGELIKRLTGLDLPRGKVKTINFGIIYGMSLPALATALHLPRDEAQKLLKDYHEAAPYARATMDECANEVHRTGMVRTILGRASDFNSWGPKVYDGKKRHAVSYDAACRKWGMFNIERQHTHKALNRKLQGSAADVMKKAMVDAWESGLFHDSACGVPSLTVHDELDFEDRGDLDNPAWDALTRCMEAAYSERLGVPLLVDGGYGKTWKECK